MAAKDIIEKSSRWNIGNGKQLTYGMIDGSQSQILLKWLACVAFTLDWRWFRASWT